MQPPFNQNPGAVAHPLVGSVLRGSYRILGVLDQGGMGTVFEAEHVRLRRGVVVKVLARHLARDPQALERFQREAEIISQLAHANIVQILDFDTTAEGEPYIVMERLEGETLAKRLERESVLPINEVTVLVQQVAAGLAAAHRASVVHRDLKPANIFLVTSLEGGFIAKLLDFGISRRIGTDRRLTGEHEVLGTPEYMAPEQALGRTAQVDQRGDQYALAVIAYEALAGATPFAGENLMDVLRRVILEQPAPIEQLSPDLHGVVWPVLTRALSKEPEARFDSALDFAHAFARAVGAGAVTARPPSSAVPVPSKRAEGRYRVAKASGPACDTDPGVSSSLADLRTQLELAREAFQRGDRELSTRCLDRAFEIAALHGAEGKRLLSAQDDLLEAIWSSWLPPSSSVRPRPTTSPDELRVLPEQAFLLSRVDGVASVEDLVDLSPLPRQETMRHLVSLLREGALEAG